MRTIQFRGKRLDNGQWAYGAPTKDRKGRPIIFHGNEYTSEFFRINPETVCRETGATDKDGRKIFEGDLIKYKSRLVLEVKWVPETLSFAGVGKSRTYDINTFKDCEVVGNIFDSPERRQMR